MVWRLLNKKCGCNWLLRFSSSAWESCVSSCAAMSLALHSGLVKVDRLIQPHN